MGYSGYVEYLCENGHYFYADALDEAYSNKQKTCHICGQDPVWYNCVDQTNDNPPGFTEFKVKTPAEYSSCKECGHSRRIKEETYHIPTEEDMKQYQKKVDDYYKEMYEQLSK